MKKIFLALVLLLCSLSAFAQYIYSNEPQFRIGRHVFALTIQESDIEGYAVVLLTNNGGIWQGWGGAQGTDATLVPTIQETDIMAYGSLKAYINHLLPQAMLRANGYANNHTPIDPSDHVTRLRYAIENIVDVVNNQLVISPPYDVQPLP